jgi:CheY-like chemotaxis protein
MGMVEAQEINLMSNKRGARPCLVVEDEPAISRLVVLAMRDLGCNDVVSAESAEEALRILADGVEPPSLVITDVRLPGMTGVELARAIKGNPRFADTKVVVMSAYGEPREHDGDGFLPKPFDLDEFEEYVSPFLQPA